MVGVRLFSLATLVLAAGLFCSGCISSGPSFPPNGAMMNGPAYPQSGMQGNYVQTAGYQPQPQSQLPQPQMQADGTQIVNGDPRLQGLGGPGMGGPGMGMGWPGPGGPGPVPTEIWYRSHPPYTVAPPDILFLDALRMIPKGPYRIEPLEILIISVANAFETQPIKGPYTVGLDGKVALGYSYPSVMVAGKTLKEATDDIQRALKDILNNPVVSVSLAQIRGMQQIRGEHLVRPDGTISLGTYGSVYVSGMTLGQVKQVVETHLSQYLDSPQISADVFAYNSKVYYVIFDGAGYGMQVFKLPITGNETVLDAVSRVNGLAAVASKRRIWLARPGPPNAPANQIMQIDWNAIVMSGSTATNYQIFPGDRIYVDSNWLIMMNNYVTQVLNPINQVMGSLFLGINTALGFQSLSAGQGLFGGFIGR